jgi:hypothetical protein
LPEYPTGMDGGAPVHIGELVTEAVAVVGVLGVAWVVSWLYRFLKSHMPNRDD